MKESTRACGLNKPQIDQSDRKDEGRFEHQSVERAQRRKLFDKSINTEGKRQRKSDPRRAALGNGEIDHTRCSQPHRDPLHGAQPFPQEEHPEQNTDQRIDEIAKAGLHDKS